MLNVHESLEQIDAFSTNIVTMQEELSHHLERASLLSRQLLEAKQELNENQRRVDNYSNDNMHLLELMSLDAVELVKVAVVQKKILNSRRLLKNGYDLLYKNYAKYKSFLSLNLIEGVDSKLRSYHFRRPEMYDFASSLKAFAKTEERLTYHPEINATVDKSKRKKLIVANAKANSTIQPKVAVVPAPTRITDTLDEEIAAALEQVSSPVNNGHVDFHVNRSQSDTINFKTPFSSRRVSVSTKNMTFSNALKDTHVFRYVVIKPKNTWILKDTSTGRNLFESAYLNKLFTYLCEHDVDDVYFHHTQFHGVMHHIHQMFVGIFTTEINLDTIETYLQKNFNLKRF